MGASSVLKLSGVTRIAVGNSQLVQATAVNSQEVLIFAKTRGVTTVDIWLSDQTRMSYRIFVLPEGLSRIQEELTRLLKNVPQARSRVRRGRPAYSTEKVKGGRATAGFV